MTTDKTVAVVTGASRGAGRGIAHALGSHGCTVYRVACEQGRLDILVNNAAIIVTRFRVVRGDAINA